MFGCNFRILKIRKIEVSFDNTEDLENRKIVQTLFFVERKIIMF